MNERRPLSAVARVSVIIPTTGRATLESAVRSAFAQQDVAIELIVVDNSGDDSLHVRERVPYPGVVLKSEPALGANGARQAGIRRATADLVALLDDDDTWHPLKLSQQLRFVSTQVLGDRWVCGHGLLRRTGETTIEQPRSFAARIDSVGDHLFRRTTLRDHYNQLQTSTLLFPKSLAIDVKWEPGVPIHQDWTWLLAAEKSGAEIYLCPEYLSEYSASVASITAKTKAADSMQWGREVLSTFADRVTVAEFMLKVPFNMLLSESRFKEAKGLLKATRHAGWRSKLRSNLALLWRQTDSLRHPPIHKSGIQ